VGLNAISIDLSCCTSDYVFSTRQMMATTGGTATYLQYATHVQSIFARRRSVRRRCGPAGFDPARRAGGARPGLEILRFSGALDATAADYQPSSC
jgi:arginyl-tRNA synthetase